MSFSRLNDDVLFEIFLHFVAIDWGGPFMLILVSNTWRKIVLSKPRLWTWIMVDDSQPDWRERLQVAAFLSKQLPLQVVLRVPFASKLLDTEIFRRYIVLFVESRYVDEASNNKTSQSNPVMPYETFHKHRSIFEDINGSIKRFFDGAPMDQIRIACGDNDRFCSTHVTWTIYEQLFAGKSLNECLENTAGFPVTTLIFNASHKSGQPLTKIQAVDIWAILGTLHHLKSLEFCDNFVEAQINTRLPIIHLSALSSLTIECHMNHPERSQEPTLHLFNLLQYLGAPSTETLVLHSSIERIMTALRTPGIRPTHLTLIVSYSRDRFYSPPRVGEFELNWLKGLTIDLRNTTEGQSSSHPFPRHLIGNLLDFLSSIPTECSLRLIGGEELELFPAQVLSGVKRLDVMYRTIVAQNKPPYYAFPGVTESLILSPGPVHSLSYLHWLLSAGEVFIESREYLEDIISLSIPQLVSITFLDCGGCGLGNAVRLADEDRFVNLRHLRCLPVVAYRIIGHFNLPRLRILSLTWSGTTMHGLYKDLAIRLVAHGSNLPRLSTLCLDLMPQPLPLLYLLGNFNKERGGGIVTLELPGLPHPSLIGEIVDALSIASAEYVGQWDLGKEFAVQHRLYSPCVQEECIPCSRGRLICFDQMRCTRFSISNMVSITKDTPIGDYD